MGILNVFHSGGRLKVMESKWTKTSEPTFLSRQKEGVAAVTDEDGSEDFVDLYQIHDTVRIHEPGRDG
jgi:hypothetical protein